MTCYNLEKCYVHNIISKLEYLFQSRIKIKFINISPLLILNKIKIVHDFAWTNDLADEMFMVILIHQWRSYSVLKSDLQDPVTQSWQKKVINGFGR